MNKERTRGYDKKFMLDLSLGFHTEIKRAAMDKGISLHSFIINAIKYYLTIIEESKDETTR